jgi:3-phenylpropionate/trans-cinnamate dioxygenase ferredoxin component
LAGVPPFAAEGLFAIGHSRAIPLVASDCVGKVTDFIEVACLDQILPGAGSRLALAGKDVAIFNVGGNICVISDTCPHAGGSLGLGKLDGKIVTCPVHGMKFDVTTGCFSGTSDFGITTYPVKVVDGKFMVAIA